jgi:hypothetical protein
LTAGSELDAVACGGGKKKGQWDERRRKEGVKGRTDEVGDDLPEPERVTDEEVGNIAFDGVHKVKPRLRRLNRQRLEDSERRGAD